MRHSNVEKYLIGCAKTSNGKKGFEYAGIRNREVAQLHPNAPLANDFDSKTKKLIPIVFNHGNVVTNEQHFGVPMILASHGYFVVSPNA